MLQMLDEDPELVFVTSDEAHFHLNGIVNRQNIRSWLPINPRQLHERPLHCDMFTVWAGVIGPYFLNRMAVQ